MLDPTETEGSEETPYPCLTSSVSSHLLEIIYMLTFGLRLAICQRESPMQHSHVSNGCRILSHYIRVWGRNAKRSVVWLHGNRADYVVLPTQTAPIVQAPRNTTVSGGYLIGSIHTVYLSLFWVTETTKWKTFKKDYETINIFALCWPIYVLIEKIIQFFSDDN